MASKRRIKGFIAFGMLCVMPIVTGLACNDTDKHIVSKARQTVENVQDGLEQSADMAGCVLDGSGLLVCAMEK